MSRKQPAKYYSCGVLEWAYKGPDGTVERFFGRSAANDALQAFLRDQKKCPKCFGYGWLDGKECKKCKK